MLWAVRFETQGCFTAASSPTAGSMVRVFRHGNDRRMKENRRIGGGDGRAGVILHA